RAATVMVVGLAAFLSTAARHTLSSEHRTAVHPVERLVSSVPEYGQLPMSFEPNKGQFDRQFQFGSEGIGYALLLKPGSATLKLGGPSAAAFETLVLKFRG